MKTNMYDGSRVPVRELTAAVNAITLRTSSDGKYLEVLYTDRNGRERVAIRTPWVGPGDGIISHCCHLSGLRKAPVDRA